MKTNQRPIQQKVVITTLIASATLILFACVHNVSAQTQPWTNANAQGNINNTNSGNVGIGTSTPDKRLTVQGDIPFGGGLAVIRTTGSNNGYGLQLDATGSGNNNLGFMRNGTPQASFAWDNSRSFLGFINVLYAPNDFTLRLNSNGSLTYHEGVSGAERFRITAAGNVGIGVTSPAFKLDVAGEIRSSSGGFRFPDGTVQTTAAVSGGGSPWTPSGSNIYFSTGNVGIGTTTPAYALDVNGSVRISTGNSLHLTRAGVNRNISFTNASNNDDLGMMTAYPSSGTNVASMFTIAPRGTGAYGVRSQLSLYNNDYVVDPANAERLQIGAYGTKFAIFSGPFGTGANRPIDIYANGTSGQLYINTNGNVGVGTTAPASKLDVAGEIRTSGGIRFADGSVQTTAAGSGGSISATNISAGQFGQNTGGGNYTFPSNVVVNGTINAKYQDMAEWVPTAQALPAATVVVLDPTQSNQVMASAQAYDTRVAGVISETPGLALGEGGPGKVLVATTGRVRVKVDASSGPIAIGDLLVTSDIPGVAMKSEPLNVGGAALHRPGTLIGKALEPLAKGKGEILVLLSLQ